ncbi:hypothetical protein VR41_12075 [Streptomyces sp. NRRL B-1568]|nr:hypothetical protein VR41_12075 [Streptomyces sp. NRRL B-1568]
MDKGDLISALSDAGVAESSYWLEGGLPSERYCLEQRADGWAVYYSERGQRTGELLFAAEDEACSELYSMILEDPTTRTSPAQRANL